MYHIFFIHSENMGSSLESIGTGDHFLNITPAAQTLRETINKWDFLKLNRFCDFHMLLYNTIKGEKAKDCFNMTQRTTRTVTFFNFTLSCKIINLWWSFFKNRLFGLSLYSIFLIGLFVLLITNFLSSLYILEIIPLSDVELVKIFSHSASKQ